MGQSAGGGAAAPVSSVLYDFNGDGCLSSSDDPVMLTLVNACNSTRLCDARLDPSGKGWLSDGQLSTDEQVALASDMSGVFTAHRCSQ